MQATSVLVVLEYATLPTRAALQAIAVHFVFSHASRLGGELTTATCPSSAAVHGGRPPGVALMIEME
jgi:hypothetical protein